MIPAHIYNDEEIFRLERERLFSRAWIFVWHESEVPQPGDYVVRRVLQDSFIIAAARTGRPGAVQHVPAPRMQVCRAEMGNASHFRCPYHGWVYRNDGRLVGLAVPPGRLRRRGRLPSPGPDPAARAVLDTYNGLIFVSLDPPRRRWRTISATSASYTRLLHPPVARDRTATARSAGGYQGELRDRRRELLAAHVPHPQDAYSVVEDPACSGAQGGEAQVTAAPTGPANGGWTRTSCRPAR